MKCVVSSRFGPICMGDTLWTYYLLISAQIIIATTKNKFGISFFWEAASDVEAHVLLTLLPAAMKFYFGITTLYEPDLHRQCVPK